MSTLFELNEHLRRVVALNFPQPLWLSAELAQVGENRGHYYLELVQKGETDDIIAQAQGVIWAADFRKMLSRHGMALRSVLQEGLELKLQVRPEFHERYGLKLQILDLDPEYTLGQLDLLRRQTVLALKEQGLFDLNRTLQLPLTLQRIAVISSETAAGLQDFLRQLEENPYGYQFHLQLFASSVQGKNAAAELTEALGRIARQAADFDCVAIVRGGGSRLDLSAFDGLECCAATALLPIPVLAGIGHDVDETVLDLVACRPLKTPTAVAAFILQHQLDFESNVLEAVERIRHSGRTLLQAHQYYLEQAMTEIRWSARERLRNAHTRLETAEQSLLPNALQLLRNQTWAVDQAEAFCRAMHPEIALRRGFSITRFNGSVVVDAGSLQPGDVLETTLHNGAVASVVTGR